MTTIKKALITFVDSLTVPKQVEPEIKEARQAIADKPEAVFETNDERGEAKVKACNFVQFVFWRHPSLMNTQNKQPVETFEKDLNLNPDKHLKSKPGKPS